MSNFKVWMEGYSVTGDSSQAQLLGEAEAETFEEACEIVVKNSFGLHLFYNKDRNTVWGCRLFNNKSDASKSFG